MHPSSELDPLLPNDPPAPEIQVYGDKRPGNTYYDTISPAPALPFESAHYQGTRPGADEDEEDDGGIASSTRSAISALGSIFTIVVFFAFVVTLLGPVVLDEPARNPRIPPRPVKTIEDRVTAILDGTPLIDGHNDLAIFVRWMYQNKLHGEFKNKFEKGGAGGDVDLPRLHNGQVGGSFWSAFVACPDDASDDFSDETYASSVSRTLAQIDLVRRIQTQYAANFTSATSSLSTALTNFHATKSLISPISIEGLHQIPQSAPLSTLRLYYALGVRAATLTWNCHNAFADAALISSRGETTIAPYHRGGLTPAGRQVVREMNRLGMLVDISHTSYWTQKAVLSNGTSAAPVIFSHSSAFTLCQHPRNVHDDILDLVKETKSLVMINFSPGFISCLAPPNSSVLPEFYDKNNTLHQVARHIIYVGERIGYDYVGLGSDFDGMGDLTPRGLEGVDKYPDLIAELLRLNVSDKDAGKIAGGNLLRVWKTANAVAETLQEKTLEGEDDVSGF